MSLLSSPFLLSVQVLFYCWLPLKGAEIFRLFPQPLQIPERGEVTSYVLLTGGNRFSFLPPTEWQVSGNAEKGEVTLLSGDQIACISFKFVMKEIAFEEKPDSGKWRKEALRRYPRAKMLSESGCYSGQGQGICFEFERVASNKAKLSTRLAFVPFADGVVEFLLTVPKEKAEHYNFTFANLLTSFRSERCPSPK